MNFRTRLRCKLRTELRRFRNISWRRIAALYLRALRLHLRTPPVPAAPERPERLVVSLTTIPERAGRLAPVLRSLLDQSEPADRILLCLPERARRSGRAYPPVSAMDLPPGVEVLRCEDQGPATKILPALRAEPGALVVAVDDDVIYPPDFLRLLLDHHRRHPDSAAGLRGLRVGRDLPPEERGHILASGVDQARRVDILMCTWGIMVPAWLTDEAFHDFEGWPEALRWVDDVWISGHLARRGVPRYVLRAESLPIETAASRKAALGRTLNRSGENDRAGYRAFAAYW